MIVFLLAHGVVLSDLFQVHGMVVQVGRGEFAFLNVLEQALRIPLPGLLAGAQRQCLVDAELNYLEQARNVVS